MSTALAGGRKGQQLEVRVNVACSRCGSLYELGSRQAKRVMRGESRGICPCCRHRDAHPPDEDDRTWWLRRFSDAEIAQMAKAIFGAGSVGAVAAWRARLASDFVRP